MHELPVTQGILRVAFEAAEEAGAERITAINLVIGDLTSIVDDSIQFYFDILSQSTPAQDAVLRIQREPAIGHCEDCGHKFVVNIPLVAVCPACDSVRLQVNGGREFYVDSIEVDDEGCS